MKEKILEAIETLDAQMEQLRRQKTKLLRELYDEDKEVYIQEKGIYDLSYIKGFEDCALEFKCPLKWDDLVETESEDVHYCEVCMENVYQVSNIMEFKKRVKEKKCVIVINDDDILPGTPVYYR
ncbi:MAG: hypothetical protein COB07_03645 [Sulfurovum sp.]|nr:MAG: hypothetical protein COB07_03645 [Sulfurovum sp.]